MIFVGDCCDFKTSVDGFRSTKNLSRWKDGALVCKGCLEIRYQYSSVNEWCSPTTDTKTIRLDKKKIIIKFTSYPQ